MDGWDDDQDVYDDENLDEIREETAPDSSSSIHQESNSSQPTAQGVLSRFEAALIASIDDDTNTSRDQDRSFGFGGGFVMKGLRGFIEAATAPQEEEDEGSFEDGWEEDFDLGEEEDGGDAEKTEYFEEDEGNRDAGAGGGDGLLKESGPVSMLRDEEIVNEVGSGWGDELDVDVSFDDENIGEGMKTGDVPDTPADSAVADNQTNYVSDSIKDFVAMTESTLNSAFNDASKTPIKTPRLEFNLKVKGKTESSSKKTIRDDSSDAVSKSLTDFVDILDAELKMLQDNLDSKNVENNIVESTSVQYSYEESKNNSPEPTAVGVKTLNLPHQESWYLNAMEGGKGGVVYSNNDLIQPAEFSSAPMSTAVGMPLSEMPSSVDSSADSHESKTNYGCRFTQSELQCTCLELILPLPDNDNGLPLEEQESGFGTKTLPDGTTVLVNYEQLLQNEAAKRILLQRSVDIYERTMGKVQIRYQASMKSTQEHEEAIKILRSQLSSVENENTMLKEHLSELEAAKGETHLFENELAVAHSERDVLENKVQKLQDDLRQTDELHSRSRDSHNLEEMKLEKSAFNQRLLAMEFDLLEAQKTNALLKNENDLIHQELRNEIQKSNIVSIESKSTADGTVTLKSRIETLENLLQQKSSDCEVLNDQISAMLSEKTDNVSESRRLKEYNEALLADVSNLNGLLDTLKKEKENFQSMQLDSEARISDLSATMECLNKNSDEAHTLAAENAALSYELEMKSTEINGHLDSLKLLQSKLDFAIGQALVTQRPYGESKFSENESALQAENEVLMKNLDKLQSELALLESDKSDLESCLEDRMKRIQSFELLLENLQSSETEAGKLRIELEASQASRDRADTLNNELKTELVTAQNNYQAQVSENQEQLAESRTEISILRSKIDEIQRHHDETTTYMEEQITGLIQQNSTLTEEYKLCFNQLGCVQKELDETKKSTSETMSRYAEQMFKYEGENLELSAALKVAKDESEKKLLEDNATKLRLSEVQEELQTINEKIDSLLSLNNLLHESNVQFQQENLVLKSKVDSIQAESDDGHLDLRTTIDQSRREQLSAETRVSELEDQVEALRAANTQLEDKYFDISFEAEENARLRRERNHFETEVNVLSERIDELSLQLSSSAPTDHFSSMERARLLSRIAELEKEINDDNINELREELTSLHEEKQQIDLDNEELLVQLGLMQQSKIKLADDAQDELKNLREKNSILQNERDEYKLALSTRNKNGIDEVVQTLRKENMDLQTITSRLSSEKKSLGREVSTVTKTLNALEQQHLTSHDLTEQLRIKVGVLENQLTDKEQEIMRIRNELEQNNDDMIKLRTECSLREITFKHMAGEVENKKNIASLDTTFGNEINDQAYQAEDVKEYDDEDCLQDLYADIVESDDYLRNQIVILAQALEKSELRRADALDRITRERKSNANSLKHLGESVKRFYSNVKCSDLVEHYFRG